MPKELTAVFFDVHIQALFFLHVPVIDPGSDHAQATQLPPMLVRYEVIRVVVADSDVRKRPLWRPRQEFARKHPIASIRHSCGGSEQFRQILTCKWSPLVRSVTNLELLSNDELV